MLTELQKNVAEQQNELDEIKKHKAAFEWADKFINEGK